MNLYLRYFDREILVKSVDEAIAFLASIDDIGMHPQLERYIREYAKSDIFYPKRYKIRPRVYFIVIKTEAATMQDFKDKKALRSVSAAETKAREQMYLCAEKVGWYEGTIEFKRVVVNHVGKCEYRDTTFTACCKANSAMDCYKRITDYLMQRVDGRSQFPSCKGKNFTYRYLGKCK